MAKTENVNTDTDMGPSTNRLTALSDGIYAIAMTLLVLNIEESSIIDTPTTTSVFNQLVSRWPYFSHYFLSFMLLSCFWIIHHVHFHYIKRTNRVLLWINLVNLMFIALLPFSTSFLADYTQFTIAAVFFHCNLLVIGMMFYTNWTYATWKHHLVAQNMSEEHIKNGRRRSLIIPIIALAAIIFAFITPRWSSMPYLFIPFMLAKENISKNK